MPEKNYKEITKAFLQQRLKSGPVPYTDWEQYIYLQINPNDAVRVREDEVVWNHKRRVGKGVGLEPVSQKIDKGKRRIISLIKKGLVGTYDFGDQITLRDKNAVKKLRFIVKDCVFAFLKERSATFDQILQEVQSKNPETTADTLKSVLTKHKTRGGLKLEEGFYIFVKEVSEKEHLERKRAEQCDGS
jgi:hypothetical protein